jgi:hypothetical protein
VPRTGGLSVSWWPGPSGTPFTLTDSTTDPDRNGSFQEPLPSGRYEGEGSEAIAVDFDSERNGARGPGFFQLDLRLGYQLPLGGARTRVGGLQGGPITSPAWSWRTARTRRP